MSSRHSETILDSGTGERLLLWGMRAWAHSVENGACPFRLLVPVFCRMGVIRGTLHFHRSMSALHLGGADLCPLAHLGSDHIRAEEAELLALWKEILAGDQRTALRLLERLVVPDWVAPCLELMATTADVFQRARPGLFSDAHPAIPLWPAAAGVRPAPTIH